MSLVTRCPSCATTFKVVRDQLRISDGWVRCGRCSHVFDASLDLQELPEPGALVPPVPEPTESAPATSASPSPLSDDPDFFDDEPLPEPVASAPAPLEVAEPGLPPEPDVDDHEDEHEHEHEPSSMYIPTPTPMAMPMPMSSYDLDVSSPAQRKDPQFFQAPLHAGAIVLPRTLHGLPSIGLVADEPWPRVVTPHFDDPADAFYATIPLIVSADPRPQADNASQVLFQKALRRARDKAAKIAKSRAKAAVSSARPIPLVHSVSGTEFAALPLLAMSATAPAPVAIPALPRAGLVSPFWRGRNGRALLGGGVVVAVLLLILQVLLHGRDTIAARQPGMRPLLVGVCAITGCQLSALQQISDITIDGAAFTREKVGDGYRLSFTLRNAASVPLAMPAVELSLLDTQEQAVVRRVLLPADFGAPAELAARGERVASMPLALDAAQAASLPPVAGYRLVAFYP